MDCEEEKPHFQNCLGEVMRGLQLANKLQAELIVPNMEAKKTCFPQEILGRLLEIVNTLNDGIKKLSPLQPQENAPFKQPTHNHGSPRKFKKRCLPKYQVKVQGVHGGFNDGYTWRKYGQKMILSKKHPRSYYHCIYKRDLDCPAVKQVQQCDGNTSYFDITYIGKHTCNHAVSPLLSPLHSNSYTSLPSTQELNTYHMVPSLKICEIESEEEVQYNGLASTRMTRLNSFIEQEMLLPPTKGTTSLEVTADNYKFPQAIEQHEDSQNSLLRWDFEINEQFPAFVDFESDL